MALQQHLGDRGCCSEVAVDLEDGAVLGRMRVKQVWPCAASTCSEILRPSSRRGGVPKGRSPMPGSSLCRPPIGETSFKRDPGGGR